MVTEQQNLWNCRSETCPFADLIDDNDNHCHSSGFARSGYDVIGEDHPDFARWLADINNVGFNDIKAKKIEVSRLPKFIPVIKRGSYKIMKGVIPPFVAVSIGDIVNPKNLDVLEGDVREKFGIDKKSKVILLCFGKDKLIEKIWTKRNDIFSKIVSLKFDLVTGINYSIWFDQPHSERLINLKRSLITYNEFQGLGLNAIPHMYWSGEKDIKRWVDWISHNKSLKIITIDPQTEKSDRIWDKTIVGLRFFVSKLDRQIQFLIIGPSNSKRINELKSIIPNLSIANGFCSRQSACGFKIYDDNGKSRHIYTSEAKNKTMKQNINFYDNILS